MSSLLAVVEIILGVTVVAGLAFYAIHALTDKTSSIDQTTNGDGGLTPTADGSPTHRDSEPIAALDAGAADSDCGCGSDGGGDGGGGGD